MTSTNLSPGRKAQYTAKWSRTMTKWLITYNSQLGAKWRIVDFCGRGGCESRGIVDLLAMRKNHRTSGAGLKRGDLLEIILLQVKGGNARRPTPQDILRLKRVARYHRASAVVLAEWKRGKTPALSVLKGNDWVATSPRAIFG